MIAFIQNYEYEGDNNVERNFKTAVLLDLPFQGQCLQQIAKAVTLKTFSGVFNWKTKSEQIRGGAFSIRLTVLK